MGINDIQRTRNRAQNYRNRDQYCLFKESELKGQLACGMWLIAQPKEQMGRIISEMYVPMPITSKA